MKKKKILFVILCHFCILIICISCSDINIIEEFLVDTIPPYIISISPSNESKGIQLDSDITVTFSEPMNTDSVESAFSLDPGNVEGTFSWSGDTTVTFTPTENLSEAFLYNITIRRKAMDVGENRMGEEFTSEFSTLTYPKITCGDAHSIYLSGDSIIWGWGSNSSFQLAQEDNSHYYPDPVEVNGLPAIGKIGSGSHCSFAISGNGELFSWGANTDGILGIGNESNTFTPTGVSLPDVTFMNVTGGKTHTIALDSDGNVWVWGDNTAGQLGVPALGEQHEPYFLDHADLNNRVIGIAAGDYHSLAIVDINDDGIGDELYTWGDNWYGEIGNGTYANIQSVPYKIPFFSAIKKVAAGSYFSIALKSDGTVWTWGRNNEGQLGIGSEVDQYEPVQVTGISATIKDIAGGYEHALALKQNGTMLAWGRNGDVQLGVGGLPQDPNYTTPQDVIKMTEVISMDAGIIFSIALKSDGSVWAWGTNIHCELGYEYADLPYTLEPVQVQIPGTD